MRIRCVFLILFPLLWASCQSDLTAETAENERISTEDTPLGMSALEEKMQGTWTATAKGCSAFEEGSHRFAFEQGMCTWNEFTQPYTLSHDTLIMGGMRFVVQESGAKVHLLSVEENCRIILSVSK